MADKYDGAEIDIFAFDSGNAADDRPEEEPVAEEEKEPTIEELMAKIDALSAEMETGDLTLEDSFAKYRQGMELIKECTKQIAAVEKQMQVLDEQGDLDDF